MKTLKNILLLGIIGLCSISVNATVTTWLGGVGDWDEDSNWDTGQSPSANDGVIITSGVVSVTGFEQANYIHLDGGDLEVHGTLLVSPDVPWYPYSSYAQLRGIVIENGSTFNNYLNTIILRGGSTTDTGFLIYCNGDMTNHADGFIFCSGDYSTGLHSYSFADTIDNYGDIAMQSVSTGMFLINPFRNYGNIEISTYGTSPLAVHNRESYYSGSGSTLQVNGRISMSSNSEWIEYGDVTVNYSSDSYAAVVDLDGTLDIKPSGSFSVAGSFAPFTVDANATFRVRGDLDISNDKLYSNAMNIQGFMVNHQKGVVTTDAYYGVLNSSGAQTLNYGIWRMNDFNYRSFKNSGSFSNRPKGKLYVEGRMELTSGSTYNNQGHMFAEVDTFHIDLSGQFNNSGTLNDVHDRMASINNNTSIRVHKMDGPFTQGVPVSNVLDKGSSPGATVLSWYTTATGNTIAGTYNNSTNTFTPNANAVGLTSLFVRTRINAGGVTRRHELIIENGILGNPSPLMSLNDKNPENTKVELNISPNPIQREFAIQVENAEASEFSYSIYSSMGQKESTGTFSSFQNSLAISDFLPSGLYFIKVFDKNGTTLATEPIRILR